VWCLPHTPLWNSSMAPSISDSVRQRNKKPKGSFQYNFASIMQYLIACNFKVIALEGVISVGHWRVRRYVMILLYQDEEENLSSIWVVSVWSSIYSMSGRESWDSKWFIPRALKLDSAINFSRHFPFTNLVGLTSKSYSWILANQFPLLPSLSGWIRISLIVLVGTYAIIF